MIATRLLFKRAAHRGGASETWRLFGHVLCRSRARSAAQTAAPERCYEIAQVIQFIQPLDERLGFGDADVAEHLAGEQAELVEQLRPGVRSLEGAAGRLAGLGSHSAIGQV